MASQQKEKRHYKGKSKSDIVNLPVDFRRNIFNPTKNKELLTAPITAHRILFKILNDISHDQFQETNVAQKQQLSLFEEDFLTENNSFARFTFKVTDIDENKDYNSVKKGLEFLEEFQKGWYSSKNSKGKTIKSYGGFISNPNISDGNITFLMSGFWIGTLLKIPRYNTPLLKTVWMLTKSKQVLFYFYLLEVPSATKINIDKFQQTYQYSYKSKYDLTKYVLKPLKEKLDKYSNKSFNYSIKGDNIHLVPYFTKDIDLKLQESTNIKREITQRIHYWKVRHVLSKNEVDVIKSIINLDNSTFKIINDAYKYFVKYCKDNQIKTTDFKGEEFINIFQNKIEEHYKQTPWGEIAPNGFPIIK